jgi:hypothetical protein
MERPLFLWPARGMQAVPGTGFFTLGSNEWLGHKVFGGHADTKDVLARKQDATGAGIGVLG